MEIIKIYEMVANNILAHDGNRIPAIKFLRNQEPWWNLAKAKNFVNFVFEDMMQQIRCPHCEKEFNTVIYVEGKIGISGRGSVRVVER